MHSCGLCGQEMRQIGPVGERASNTNGYPQEQMIGTDDVAALAAGARPTCVCRFSEARQAAGIAAMEEKIRYASEVGKACQVLRQKVQRAG